MRKSILAALAIATVLLMGCEQERTERHVGPGSGDDASAGETADAQEDHGAAGEVAATEDDQGTDNNGDHVPAGVRDASSNAAAHALDGMADEPAVSGIDAFLWKPISESDGNAVALFPAKYRADRIVRVFIQGGARNGEVPLRVYWPDGHNGNRVHARWASAGSAYGKEFKVAAVLATGRHIKWLVRDGKNRQEM